MRVGFKKAANAVVDCNRFKKKKRKHKFNPLVDRGGVGVVDLDGVIDKERKRDKQELTKK